MEDSCAHAARSKAELAPASTHDAPSLHSCVASELVRRASPLAPLASAVRIGMASSSKSHCSTLACFTPTRSDMSTPLSGGKKHDEDLAAVARRIPKAKRGKTVAESQELGLTRKNLVWVVEFFYNTRASLASSAR